MVISVREFYFEWKKLKTNILFNLNESGLRNYRFLFVSINWIWFFCCCYFHCSIYQRKQPKVKRTQIKLIKFLIKILKISYPSSFKLRRINQNYNNQTVIHIYTSNQKKICHRCCLFKRIYINNIKVYALW